MSDVKNSYEAVSILFTTQGEEAVQTNVQEPKTLIEKNVVVDSVDEWGKRRFACPIEKQTGGYYTLISLTSAPNLIMELDRIHKITDGVFRPLTVKKEVKREKSKKVVEVQKTETVERERPMYSTWLY